MPEISVLITHLPDDSRTYATSGLKQQTYSDYTLHTLETTKPLAAARNQLAKKANGDVYAFLDADAHPGEHWLEELAEGYEDGAIAVGGPAKPAHTDDYHRNIPKEWQWLIGCGPYYDCVRRVRNTYGCNFSMKADVFDELGGFNTEYGKGSRVPHGEETELASRMHERYGERMQYRPDALVYHQVYPEQTRLIKLLRRSYDQGRTKGSLGLQAEERNAVSSGLLDGGWFTRLLVAAGGLGYVRERRLGVVKDVLDLRRPDAGVVVDR